MLRMPKPLVVALLAVCTLSAAALAVDPRPALPGTSGPPEWGPNRVSAPVFYEKQMLVVVTADGVAAFKFGNSFDHGKKVGIGVEYRYRYLATGATEEEEGQSTAFEKYDVLPDGGLGGVGGVRWLEAGKVKIEWSAGGPGHGWVYYAPEDVAVLVVKSDWFEEKQMNFPGEGVTRRPPLDLRRFRKLPR